MQQKSSFSLLSFLKLKFFVFLFFFSNTGVAVRSCVITESKKAEWGQVDFSDCMNLEIRKIYADVSRNVNYFIYLFIYKLRQKSWITHRESSTMRSGKKKKRKLVIQLTRMTIL